ncbi:hypothetical protein HK405_009081, partial [Cladochytrium tenue]
VSHVRIVRDSLPNRYMVLLKFRDARGADAFYRQFSGRPFSSLDAEVCHVVYVKSIEFKSQAVPPYAFPPMLQDDEGNKGTAAVSDEAQGDGGGGDGGGAGSVPADAVELPTCPVCLERMDASVTGLVTIVCHHTFHCQCLSKWGDSSCPVCRYSQWGGSRGGKRQVAGAGSRGSGGDARGASSASVTASLETGGDGTVSEAPAAVAPPVRENECAACGTAEDLWICLVCGNIGCGRYRAAHARQHFEATSHGYALELETQRVWDYAGDGYVHRLIQNRTDGKLVELPAAASGGGGLGRGGGGAGVDLAGYVPVSQSKLDAIGHEYSSMLTLQLESQRMWYEAQLAELSTTAATQASALSHELAELRREASLREAALTAALATAEAAARTAAVERDAARAEAAAAARERRASERRGERALERLAALERAHAEERAINASLRANQDSLKAELEAKAALVAENARTVEGLSEQVRDLMFYVEAQAKINNGELGAEGRHMARRLAARFAAVVATVAAVCGAAASTARASAGVRGVAVVDQARYEPVGGKFECLDGSRTIAFAAVNDDYCDCADGSDEPGTSACPNGRFHCANIGHISSYIPSSRVGDGVCEPLCCDGSDEAPGVCADRCQDEARAERELQRTARQRGREGGRRRREAAAAWAARRAVASEEAERRRALLGEVGEREDAAKRDLETAEAVERLLDGQVKAATRMHDLQHEHAVLTALMHSIVLDEPRLEAVAAACDGAAVAAVPAENVGDNDGSANETAVPPPPPPPPTVGSALSQYRELSTSFAEVRAPRDADEAELAYLTEKVATARAALDGFLGAVGELEAAKAGCEGVAGARGVLEGLVRASEFAAEHRRELDEREERPRAALDDELDVARA